LGIKTSAHGLKGDMHVATRIGLFYAAFWGLEWFGYLSLDHVTLAVAAVFCAGVMEDSLAEERRKREIVRRNRHLMIDPNTGKIVRAGPAQNPFYARTSSALYRDQSGYARCTGFVAARAGDAIKPAAMQPDRSAPKPVND